MRERPILMTTENAQKCHDGTKTQTRRIMKVQPDDDAKILMGELGASHGVAYIGNAQSGGLVTRVQSPFGIVGDRLWVREAWAPCHECPYEIYKGQNVKNCPSCDASTSGLRWKPSLYMPRWACRTVLEITDVRVERLKDISPADALAEGVFCPDVGYAQHGDRAPVLLYGFLWESIHGTGSWAMNPWVWVIEFRKVEVER